MIIKPESLKQQNSLSLQLYADHKYRTGIVQGLAWIPSCRSVNKLEN